jgi:peptidoglycan-associated lipoprotein
VFGDRRPELICIALFVAAFLGCRRSEPSACSVNCPEVIAQTPAPVTCEPGSCEPCTAASECSTGICHASGRCEAPACATDDACPSAEICDGNQCLPEPAADAVVCGIATLTFAFDSAKLSPGNQERLAHAMPCLLEQLAGSEAARLSIEGNGDRLGSDDYQLALAQRRADSIRAFLLGRGLPEARLRVVHGMFGEPRSGRLTIMWLVSDG